MPDFARYCSKPGDEWGDAGTLIDLVARGSPAWHKDAACREHPELSWFPERGEDVRPAKRVCEACLVCRVCREWAVGHGLPWWASGVPRAPLSGPGSGPGVWRSPSAIRARSLGETWSTLVIDGQGKVQVKHGFHGNPHVSVVAVSESRQHACKAARPTTQCRQGRTPGLLEITSGLDPRGDFGSAGLVCWLESAA